MGIDRSGNEECGRGGLDEKATTVGQEGELPRSGFVHPLLIFAGTILTADDPDGIYHNN
jgi:hypothetical protein